MSARSAAFVRSVRERFKHNADGILKYLMSAANDYLSASDRVSGYSQASIPFDREVGRDMTPAQRVAFTPREPGFGFLRLFRNGGTLRGLVSVNALQQVPQHTQPRYRRCWHAHTHSL